MPPSDLRDAITTCYCYHYDPKLVDVSCPYARLERGAGKLAAIGGDDGYRPRNRISPCCLQSRCLTCRASSPKCARASRVALGLPSVLEMESRIRTARICVRLQLTGWLLSQRDINGRPSGYCPLFFGLKDRSITKMLRARKVVQMRGCAPRSQEWQSRASLSTLHLQSGTRCGPAIPLLNLERVVFYL